MYSLMRNIGSSIGISMVVTLLARNTQVNHASLAATMQPFRPALAPEHLPKIWDWTTTAGTVALNGEVTRQANITHGQGQKGGAGQDQGNHAIQPGRTHQRVAECGPTKRAL